MKTILLIVAILIFGGIYMVLVFVKAANEAKRKKESQDLYGQDIRELQESLANLKKELVSIEDYPQSFPGWAKNIIADSLKSVRARIEIAENKLKSIGELGAGNKAAVDNLIKTVDWELDKAIEELAVVGKEVPAKIQQYAKQAPVMVISTLDVIANLQKKLEAEAEKNPDFKELPQRLEVEKNSLLQIQKNLTEGGKKYLASQGLEACEAIQNISNEVESIETDLSSN